MSGRAGDGTRQVARGMCGGRMVGARVASRHTAVSPLATCTARPFASTLREIRWTTVIARPGAAPLIDLPPPSQPPTDAAIDALLRAGRKTDAINVHRQLYGVDAKTAKEAIEARYRFMPLTPRQSLGFQALLLLLLGGVIGLTHEGGPPWGLIIGASMIILSRVGRIVLERKAG